MKRVRSFILICIILFPLWIPLVSVTASTVKSNEENTTSKKDNTISPEAKKVFNHNSSTSLREDNNNYWTFSNPKDHGNTNNHGYGQFGDLMDASLISNYSYPMLIMGGVIIYDPTIFSGGDVMVQALKDIGMVDGRQLFENFLDSLRSDLGDKKQVLGQKKGDKIRYDVTKEVNAAKQTNSNSYVADTGQTEKYAKNSLEVGLSFKAMDRQSLSPLTDSDGEYYDVPYVYYNQDKSISATLEKVDDKAYLTFERLSEGSNSEDSSVFTLTNLSAYVNITGAVEVDASKGTTIFDGTIYMPVLFDFTNYDATVNEDLGELLDVESKADMEVKDIDVEQGSNWDPQSQIVSVTDDKGNKVDDTSVVTTSGDVDTNKVGDYPVTFIYDVTSSSQIRREATVHVTEQTSKASLKVRNIGIQLPPTTSSSITYTDEDKKYQILSATDDDGNSVDSSEVTVEGVDKITGRPAVGTKYDLTFKYTSASGKQVTATGSATVTDAFIHAKNVYKKAGESYIPTESFDFGLDDTLDGHNQNLTADDERLTYSSKEHVIAEDEKNSDVNITYTSKNNPDVNIISATKKLIVSKAEIDTQDSTIYVGDTWDPSDNIKSAVDVDGNSIEYDKSWLDTSDVDVTKPGTYTVNYKMKDSDGIVITSASAKVTVLANQESIKAKDSKIYVGDTWNPEDNFDSATDKDGKPVEYSKDMVSGTVDTTKAGSYEVTFKNGGAEDTATVTVVENQESIKAHDSTLHVGDTWDPKDNFDSATDKDGKTVEYSKDMVSGSVDTNTEGTYKVTYTNGSHKQEVTVTVEKVVVPYFDTVPTKIGFGDDIDLGLSEYLTHAVSDYDAPLTVVDGQKYKGGWDVQATVLKDLQTDDNSSVLNSSLMYDDNQLSGQSTTILTVPKQTEPSDIENTVNLSSHWKDGKGLLLNAKRQGIIADTKYSGSVEWTLVLAP